MAETRNLTYLGNPYVEGQGTSYALPTDPNTANFFTAAMKRAREEAALKKAADEAKKAENQKVIDNFKVDAGLLYSGAFTERAKKLKEEGQMLLATNHDLNDDTNKYVRDWRKRKEEIMIDADLAKKTEAYGKEAIDIIQDPTKSSKFTKASKQSVLDFYMPIIDGDIEKYNSVLNNVKKNGVPTMQLLKPLPKDVADGKFIDDISAKYPQLIYGKTPDEIKTINENLEKDVMAYLDATLDVNMEPFDVSTDPAENKKALEDFKKVQALRVKEILPDTKSADQIAIQKAQQDLAERKHALDQQEFFLKKSAHEAKMITESGDFEMVMRGAALGDERFLNYLEETIQNTEVKKAGNKTVPVYDQVRLKKEVWTNKDVKDREGKAYKYSGTVYIPEGKSGDGEWGRIPNKEVIFGINSNGDYSDNLQGYNVGNYQGDYYTYQQAKTKPGAASNAQIGAKTYESKGTKTSISGTVDENDPLGIKSDK